MQSSSTKSQSVMPISASSKAHRTHASEPFHVRKPRLPMITAYTKSRAACRRSSVPVPWPCGRRSQVFVVVERIEGPEQRLDEEQPDRRVHSAACDGRMLPPYPQMRWPCHSTLTSTCQPSGSGDTRARNRGRQDRRHAKKQDTQRGVLVQQTTVRRAQREHDAARSVLLHEQAPVSVLMRGETRPTNRRFHRRVSGPASVRAGPKTTLSATGTRSPAAGNFISATSIRVTR